MSLDSGDSLWLEMAVDGAAESGAYVELSPAIEAADHIEADLIGGSGGEGSEVVNEDCGLDDLASVAKETEEVDGVIPLPELAIGEGATGRGGGSSDDTKLQWMERRISAVLIQGWTSAAMPRKRMRSAALSLDGCCPAWEWVEGSSWASRMSRRLG